MELFMREALRERDAVGGAFSRRYASPSLILRLTCFLAHQRNRLIGWHLGDQAMSFGATRSFDLAGSAM
jgi:hypothetical protein